MAVRLELELGVSGGVEALPPPAIEVRDDGLPVGLAHDGPPRDLVDGPLTADAAVMRVEDADLGARGLHGRRIAAGSLG